MGATKASKTVRGGLLRTPPTPAIEFAWRRHWSRSRRKRHIFITETAETSVSDHVLESINGHLLRRMLEHYSHIRLAAKRQAFDALDDRREQEPAAAAQGRNDRKISCGGTLGGWTAASMSIRF